MSGARCGRSTVVAPPRTRRSRGGASWGWARQLLVRRAGLLRQPLRGRDLRRRRGGRPAAGRPVAAPRPLGRRRVRHVLAGLRRRRRPRVRCPRRTVRAVARTAHVGLAPLRLGGLLRGVPEGFRLTPPWLRRLSRPRAGRDVPAHRAAVGRDARRARSGAGRRADLPPARPPSRRGPVGRRPSAPAPAGPGPPRGMPSSARSRPLAAADDAASPRRGSRVADRWWAAVAPGYDRCVRLVGWHAAQESLVADLAGGTVLEVGCGPAHLAAPCWPEASATWGSTEARPCCPGRPGA